MTLLEDNELLHVVPNRGGLAGLDNAGVKSLVHDVSDYQHFYTNVIPITVVGDPAGLAAVNQEILRITVPANTLIIGDILRVECVLSGLHGVDLTTLGFQIASNLITFIGGHNNDILLATNFTVANLSAKVGYSLFIDDNILQKNHESFSNYFTIFNSGLVNANFDITNNTDLSIGISIPAASPNSSMTLEKIKIWTER